MSQTAVAAETVLFQGVRLQVLRDLNTRKQGEHRRQTRVVLLKKSKLVAHLPEPGFEGSLNILRHEYEVLRQIHHPGFPRVYGPIGRNGEFGGYLREYILEYDLFWRRLFPNFTLRQLLRNGAILAFGLERFHRTRHNGGCAQVMRDIKPDNVCFRRQVWRDGSSGLIPVFTDFNAITDAGYRAEDDGWKSVKLTPVFAAPEQVTGPGTVTQFTDQWALGMLLKSVALGIQGYFVPGESEKDRLVRAASGLYPYWGRLTRLLPETVCDTLEGATFLIPNRRFPSCGIFGMKLRELIRTLPEDVLDRTLPPIPTSQELRQWATPLSLL